MPRLPMTWRERGSIEYYVTCSGQACEVNGEADVCKIGEERIVTRACSML
jgi:hypothetical protein